PKIQIGGIAVFSVVAATIITLGEANRRARSKGRASMEELRLAQQIGRVGSFEWNIKTDMNRWTPELEAMYGLSPGPFGGTFAAWEKMLHPDDLEEAKRHLQEAFDKGEFEGEWRAIWPDGSVHWLLARGYIFKDNAGKPERMLGVNIDVSERREAE